MFCATCDCFVSTTPVTSSEISATPPAKSVECKAQPIRELDTLRSIPSDVSNIIESYGKYQTVSGKLKRKIPSPAGIFDIVALQDNIAVVKKKNGDVDELHISKVGPSGELPDHPGELPDQPNHHRLFDCSFDPTPFHKYPKGHFSGQKVLIDRDFIYTLEFSQKEDKDGKYYIHVFNHNGRAFANFTIEKTYGEYASREIIVSSGYLWIAEKHCRTSGHQSKKLDQSNVRQFSSKGELLSSYFFDFYYRTFCIDPIGKHIFMVDREHASDIYKFKLDGKKHNPTEIMKSIGSYLVGKQTFNMKDIDGMIADECDGLVISIGSRRNPRLYHITRFSTVDNTFSWISGCVVHCAQLSVSSNGNVVVWGADEYVRWF